MTKAEKLGTAIALGLVTVGVIGIPLGWGLYGLFVTLAGLVCQLTVYQHVRSRVRARRRRW